MTKQEYLEPIFGIYSLVSCLSNKPHSEVLHLRHKQLGKDIILRYSPLKLGAYEYMSVALPKTLKLYADSFADCFSLGLISYAGTKNDWNNLDFVKNNEDWISGPSGDVYVRCTDGDIIYYD